MVCKVSGWCLKGVWRDLPLEGVSNIPEGIYGMSKWYVGWLDVSEGQVRIGQVSTGQVRTGQVRTGQVRTGSQERSIQDWKSYNRSSQT